MIYSIL